MLNGQISGVSNKAVLEASAHSDDEFDKEITCRM